MYKMYDKSKIAKLVLILIGLFLLFMGFIVIPQSIINQGWSFKNILLFFGSITMSMCLFKMSLFTNEKSYYADIQQLKATNPDLVLQYEKEFETAEKICENIWISDNFCYIRTATKLKVITISQLKKIVLYRTYSREACLDMDLFTDDETITVTSYVGLSNKAKAIAYAEKLSRISSAVLKLYL